MLMVAETISLGILALPTSLATLGLIPGLVLLVFFGVLATYTGYVIGQLRLRHENVHSMADAGFLLFGRVGREVVMAGQILFVIFIMGAHILSFGVAMNALVYPGRGVCAVVYLFGAFVVSFLLTIPRTLRHMSYYSIVSFVSIIAAVLVTMIAVAVQKPGWTSKDVGQPVGLGVADPLGPNINLWPQAGLSFHAAFNAVCNIVFAYAGHVAFFSFISELKDPKDFPKALAFLQISDVSMYIITAVVIGECYCFQKREAFG